MKIWTIRAIESDTDSHPEALEEEDSSEWEDVRESEVYQAE